MTADFFDFKRQMRRPAAKAAPAQSKDAGDKAITVSQLTDRIKHVITTGDKIPASSLAELPKLFPNARFYNVYGCTETNDSLVHEDVAVPSPVGRHWTFCHSSRSIRCLRS